VRNFNAARDSGLWYVIGMFTRAVPFALLCCTVAFTSQAADTDPPTIISISPLPGTVSSLTQVTVTFSEPVLGVTADDFLINTQPANTVSTNGETYTFTFAQPDYGNVSITWFPEHGITDLALPPNAFNATAPGATWQYTLLDSVPPTVSSLFPAANATVRSLGQVEVTFSEEVSGVTAGDLLINGQPATNVTRVPSGPYTFQFATPSPGTVQFQWAAGHGITDQAEVPNPFGGGAWTYVYDPNAPTGDLLITEFLASNTMGLRDPGADPLDPDPLPWIEILNRGAAPVNLSGWSLSDDDEAPGLWVFPARMLQPGEYLVVFASGLDIKNPTGTNRFHTNFKLSRVGEFLGLYSPDSPRVLVSGFSPGYPEQRNDYSYGRDSNGNLRYFATPTPGGPNGVSSITGVVEPVHFSVHRGLYTQPFNLVLSCPTPAANIRYTTDGSEPTSTNGFAYSTPLRVTNTVMLRAVASRANLLPSQIITHSYLFNFPAVQRSLPILNIVTATNNFIGRSGIIGMGGGTRASDGLFITNNPATDYHNPSAHGIAWERPVSAEYILPGDNSGFQIDCGIRVHGSDWQRPRTLPTSKFSFRLYFRGDYGPGTLDYPLFPLTTLQEFDQIVLRAGFNEQANPFIRDEIIRRMSHDMGQVASHGNLMLLLLNGGPYTNNASLTPVYNPCERVHEEMMQSYFGGSDEWDVVGPTFAESSEGPGVVDGDRNDFNSLMNYIWTQQTATTITNPVVYAQVARRLDLVNFVDYCLLNAYTAMGDWPANNWRAAHEHGNTNSPWRFIVWDAEWGMGIYALTVTRDSFAFSGTGTDDAGLNSTANAEIARIYQRLRPNREFRLLWADRIQKHLFNGGALTGLNITNRFNQLRDELLGFIPSMDTEILGWARDRQNIIMGQFNTYGLYGYSNALYGIFASSNAPAFSQHGGRVPPGFSVTMAAPIVGSVIYYTTNGADPRVPFTGAVSNAATAYSGPITLNRSTLVRARALLNGTNWSAINEATFEVARVGVPIRITEIHYNPADGPAYEFIELQNIGSSGVDLSGFTMDGVSYTFNVGASLAAGAKIVLASDLDPVAFATRYPGVPVFGHFGGSLNNGGERIALLDSNGNIVTSVDYDDAGGWPTKADGGGSSLEVIDPFGDPDDPANWRPSSIAGGTPGTMPAGPPLGDVRLNEVLAENLSAVDNGGTFPDYVELNNTGASTVNLSGWSLTDDGNARKFVFPGGTTISPGGYLVIWCDSVTNTAPGLHSGFAFGGGGDNVSLFDQNTNRVDALSFGLQLPDYSVGHVGGTWVLNTPTPNAANAAASTASAGALSINEWLANSLPGQPDWIELYNTATQPVALRGIYFATTGAVHEVTSLSFIGAGGFAQFFADEGVGPDHLDFKLPAIGGSIILYDQTATEVNRVSYTNSLEGVTRGRLPDGTATIVNFPGSASPGASNYVNNYTGPKINELLARNQSAVTNAGNAADFVELFNSGVAMFDLGGFSLSVNSQQAGEWIFPPNTMIPANGYLVVWCDGSRPLSTNASDFNTGEALEGDSGGVYLFNPAGQLVDSVEYGLQVIDRSIGLSAGQWRLLDTPTPGAANSTNALLGAAGLLRINEWMANPATGPDWFEVYNSTNLPVDLSGLILTDDPSTVGLTQFRIAPLSYIGSKGFVRWIADGDTDEGRNHVNFILDAQGETLRLYTTNGPNFILIDGIEFGLQLLGISQGRLLDGEANIVSFPGSPTPGDPNALAEPNIVVNEVLSHADQAIEDAIELLNVGTNAVNIGGWFLSNSQDDFKKYRIPDNTIVQPGGFAVFYEYQFGGVTPTSFTLNSAHGDEVWLSGADPVTGRLSGYRTSAKFGAAADGISFGRYVTTLGIDYVALSQRTFGVDVPSSLTQFRTGTGLPNAAPRIGPIIINEIMYNPPDGVEEYIELWNLTTTPVALNNPLNSTNRWRLNGGITFTFPADTTLEANGFALVVDFDPAASPAALATFRARYGVSPDVPVFGPFAGHLGNGGDSIELQRPDTPQEPGLPDAGFVPYLLVDKVHYSDSAPWPSGLVDGGGLSLQREDSSSYGNEPLNWVAANPTPGSTNSDGVVPPPTIVAPPQNLSVLEGAAPVLAVAASGAGPIHYQWRLNGTPVPDATNFAYSVQYAVDSDEGQYDVIVSNPGGAAVGGPATLEVRVPPVIISPLVNQTAPVGRTVTNIVAVRGDAPLAFVWRLNGTVLSGANGPTLIRTNVQLADDGLYDVLISNPVATVISSATLTVLSNTVITLAPISQSVITGAVVTVSVEAFGNPLPFGYEWRRGSATVASNTANSYANFFTFTAPTNITTQLYRVVVRNVANPSTTANAQFNITTLADTDADGIPDVWESNFGMNTNRAADGALDFDLDGMSNYAEYIAGTDPTNALSYLRVDLDADPDAAIVSFNAISNRTYTVRYTDALGSGAWFRLTDVLARATNRVESILDSNWRDHRFYQVITPRQP
jgi:hypothetical protein